MENSIINAIISINPNAEVSVSADDIDTIVDFHILYSVIYLSFYFEYIPLDILNFKLWYGLMACIYIRNIFYKIYKKIF